jgi:hypothetical protein
MSTLKKNGDLFQPHAAIGCELPKIASWKNTGKMHPRKDSWRGLHIIGRQ